MINRRQFLQAGIGGGALLLAARLAYGPFAPDPGFSAGNAHAFTVLDDKAKAAIAAIANAMLGSMLPADNREQALREAVIGVDIAIAGLPLAVQQEVADLLKLLTLPLTRRLLVGVAAPWQQASSEDIAHFLNRWRYSSFTLLRSGYQALHQIIYAAWYGNPHSWTAIGYSGPPQYVRQALYNEQ